MEESVKDHAWLFSKEIVRSLCFVKQGSRSLPAILSYFNKSVSYIPETPSLPQFIECF